jgi:hypothetical protein
MEYDVPDFSPVSVAEVSVVATVCETEDPPTASVAVTMQWSAVSDGAVQAAKSSDEESYDVPATAETDKAAVHAESSPLSPLSVAAVHLVRSRKAAMDKYVRMVSFILLG